MFILYPSFMCSFIQQCLPYARQLDSHVLAQRWVQIAWSKQRDSLGSGGEDLGRQVGEGWVPAELACPPPFENALLKLQSLQSAAKAGSREREVMLTHIIS